MLVLYFRISRALLGSAAYVVLYARADLVALEPSRRCRLSIPGCIFLRELSVSLLRFSVRLLHAVLSYGPPRLVSVSVSFKPGVNLCSAVG